MGKPIEVWKRNCFAAIRWMVLGTEMLKSKCSFSFKLFASAALYERSFRRSQTATTARPDATVSAWASLMWQGRRAAALPSVQGGRNYDFNCSTEHGADSVALSLSLLLKNVSRLSRDISQLDFGRITVTRLMR
jgi:hypothetical protein